MIDILIKSGLIFGCIFLLGSLLNIILYSKKGGKLNKPHRNTIFSLIALLTLILLFFSGFLEHLPKAFAYFLWIGTVIFGFTSGLKYFKNNNILSAFNIVLSVSMSGFILLMLFITGM